MTKKIFKKIYNAFPYKRQLFSIIKKIFPSLSEDIYKHLHFKGVINVAVDKENDIKFKVYSDSERIENQIFWRGIDSWYEKVSMQHWIKICKISEVIFDIGAYHGIYALVAASIHENNKVFAFEPVEDSYKKMVRNVKLNNFSIHTFNCAISGKDGEAGFYNIDASSSLIGSLNKESFTYGEKLIKHIIPVRSVNSIVKEFNLPKIDLMKIDVEGHEIEVLQGMYNHLEKDKPSIILEVLTDERAQVINKLLKGLGYLYFDIDEQNSPIQIPEIKKSGYFNILICPPDVARKINLI